MKKQNKEKISVPKSAQDLIDIDTLYKDGIFCSKNKYSKTYRFKDINYSIASKDEKVGLFLNYSELLNSLDSSTMTKITINNRKILFNYYYNFGRMVTYACGFNFLSVVIAIILKWKEEE